MKKMLVVLILMFIVSSSYADTIPGYLEFKYSFSNYRPITINRKDIFISEVYFKYGGFRNSYFSPYVFGVFKTYGISEGGFKNYPFAEKYSMGSGINIYKIFFVKFTHTCTHKVFSPGLFEKDVKIYNEYTAKDPEVYKFSEKLRITDNRLEIGIRIVID